MVSQLNRKKTVDKISNICNVPKNMRSSTNLSIYEHIIKVVKEKIWKIFFQIFSIIN